MALNKRNARGELTSHSQGNRCLFSVCGKRCLLWHFNLDRLVVKVDRLVLIVDRRPPIGIGSRCSTSLGVGGDHRAASKNRYEFGADFTHFAGSKPLFASRQYVPDEQMF